MPATRWLRQCADPTSDSDALLNSVHDAMLATLQGTVSNELDNEKQGVPVRELTITPPNQRDRVLVQVYLKDTRLYILTVTTPKEFIRSDNVTRFFDSFQIAQKSETLFRKKQLRAAYFEIVLWIIF